MGLESTEPIGLTRQLTAIQGAALIAGGIIGSGIFTTPSEILRDVGSPGAALMLWTVGAAVAYVGAMVYGELGCRIPLSGGDAQFLDVAFPRPRHLLAILYSWTRVILLSAGFNASLSITASKYLIAAFPSAFESISISEAYWINIISTILLILQTIICILSNKLAGHFCTAVTVVSVMSLVFFSFTGIAILCGAAPSIRVIENFAPSVLFAGTTPTISRWATAFSNVMWSYDGWSNLASSLSELKDPNRNVKRSSIMGLCTVAALFLLANVGYIVAMPLDEIKTAGNTLGAKWAERIFGANGAIYISVVIFLVSTACGFISLFTSSRIAQATGASNLICFPETFAKLNNRFGTPVNALVINLVLSIALLWSVQGDTFSAIISVVNYPLWIFYSITASSLLVIKVRDAHLSNTTTRLSTLRSMFYKRQDYEGLQVSPIYAIIVIVVGIFITVLPFTGEKGWKEGLYGMASVLVGLLSYGYLVYRSKHLSPIKAST